MKPVSLTGSWVIKAPLKSVYKIVTDFEKTPAYFPTVAKSLRIIKKTGNHLSIQAVTKTFGMPFKVKMETDLLPNKGFKSINESALAIEDETFLMEEIPSGTKINYQNNVTIKNNLLKLFSRLLIGKPALIFWEHAYIDRLRKIAENYLILI
jgi:carbon monoxide dehydrogenase subunit G